LNNEYFKKFGFPQPMDDIREYWRDWKMGKITNQMLYDEQRAQRVVLLGVPDSEDMGLYGEVKDIKKLVKEINGTVKSDHTWIRAYRYAFYAVFAILATIVTGNRLGFW